MTVSLLFGVHMHQPIGNFTEVIDDAHVRCYRPFFRTLYEYPDFRFALHTSGWLLGVLATRHPDDVALIARMVERGQVEIFGGGDTEPVLASIPYADRVSQIRALSDRLERETGARPEGAWLTERVWEPTVVPALVDTGIRFVTVDDYHFLCTGIAPEALDGYYRTEEDGRVLDLYPISEALRYRLPFSPAAEAVTYIESLAGGRPGAAAVYFDDIEKFGIWPETYEWVYGKGWLTGFVEGVLASQSIRTEAFAAHHRRDRSRGVVYLPTTSYIEMNEWTLPGIPGSRYAELVEDAKREKRFDVDKPFLRGGIWRNFLSRYPESNWMHKRMLGLSARVHALGPGRATVAMFEQLHGAQANDAYWHGLFGGLYLPHLRRAVWNAIVTLEGMLDAVAPRGRVETRDLDHDGIDECFLRGDRVQAVVRLDAHGAVLELSSYPLQQNFGDTLRRYDEHYHRLIDGRADAAHAAAQKDGDGEGIANPHGQVVFKHEIGPQDLLPDVRPRGMFLDDWIEGGDVFPAEYRPIESGAGALFEGRAGSARVTKRYAMQADGLAVEYRIDARGAGVFCTTLNVAMPSCDGYSGRYVFRGDYPGGFGQVVALPAVDTIALDDTYMEGMIHVKCDPPARFSASPHVTVSQSEAGFEKIMQAACVVLEWPLQAGARTIRVSLTIESYRKPA